MAPESVALPEAPEDSDCPDFFLACFFVSVALSVPPELPELAAGRSLLDPYAPLPPELLPDVAGDVAEGELELSVAAPVALCERLDGVGEVVAPPLACANASEDTDAIATNESDRSVDFNVICNSLVLEKKHHRCISFDAPRWSAFRHVQTDRRKQLSSN
jgi:hypothetical protein